MQERENFLYLSFLGLLLESFMIETHIKAVVTTVGLVINRQFIF